MSSHPKDFSDDLISVIATEKKVSKDIHLPLQSGSDKILKLMNRNYTAKKYYSIIKKLKDLVPNCTITTDIIVGFPGETKKDFNQTVKMIKKVSAAAMSAALVLGNGVMLSAYATDGEVTTTIAATETTVTSSESTSEAVTSATETSYHSVQQKKRKTCKRTE